MAIKKEGFTITYKEKDIDVEPVYLDDLIHYKVKLQNGEKFLRLEEKEGKKLSWSIRGEGHTTEADVLGNLIESKIM